MLNRKMMQETYTIVVEESTELSTAYNYILAKTLI